MAPNYKKLSNSITTENPINSFALDVLIGLSEHPKHLQSKYFYDDKGSVLFQKIMNLPEYYLTNCEYEILDTQKGKIAEILQNSNFNLIELGAGDGLKTTLLLEEFLAQNFSFKYVPLDISEIAVTDLTERLSKTLPTLKTQGLVAEYVQGLNWLSHNSNTRNVVLFLGSNLGNFSHAQGMVFLRSLWNALNDGDIVIIGFDLKKDIDLMLHAYNDAQGVTAEFNLNLLDRINAELGGNFEKSQFRFYATYNVFSGAIESYLVSLLEQEVFIKEIGQSFHFKEWEPIHTEYSYKFLKSDIHLLAKKTGFSILAELYDQKRYFTDSVWQVKKNG